MRIIKTLDHVAFLARKFSGNQIQHVITVLLIEIGVPTNYDGFDYLVKAISIFCTDPTQMIMKGLYPAVARQYSREIEASQIEQAIRGAIRVAWRKRDPETWNLYFPPELNGQMDKPTNTEFVSRLAYVVELWKACCDKYDVAKEVTQ